MSTISCLVIDDHALARAGLVHELSALSGISVAGEAESVERAISFDLIPDVVLLDLHLPGGRSGARAVEAILDHWPDTHILVVTVNESAHAVLATRRAGALGYVTKHAVGEELIEAIVSVAEGKLYVTPRLASYVLDEERHQPVGLTPRELEVLGLLAEGARVKQIARRLGIEERTVNGHLEHIRDKTGFRDRLELADLARQLELVDDPSVSTQAGRRKGQKRGIARKE
jgi:DNA-binding NarL/FixJ family response regulator